MQCIAIAGMLHRPKTAPTRARIGAPSAESENVSRVEETGT